MICVVGYPCEDTLPDLGQMIENFKTNMSHLYFVPEMLIILAVPIALVFLAAFIEYHKPRIIEWMKPGEKPKRKRKPATIEIDLTPMFENIERWSYIFTASMSFGSAIALAILIFRDFFQS